MNCTLFYGLEGLKVAIIFALTSMSMNDTQFYFSEILHIFLKRLAYKMETKCRLVQGHPPPSPIKQSKMNG